MPNFSNIRSIVYDYIVERGDYSMNDYLKYKRIAIRGLAQLNVYNFKNVRVTYLDVSIRNTCILPEDFMKETKVGLNFKERIFILTENPNIVLPRTEECGLETRDTISSNANVSLFAPYTYNDVYYGSTFGIVGAQNDIYYRVDKEYNQLVLEGAVPAGIKILLEYYGNGIEAGEDSLVPELARECLIAWLRWREDPRDRNAQDLYGIELRKMRNVNWGFSIEQFNDAMLQVSSQAVKR